MDSKISNNKFLSISNMLSKVAIVFMLGLCFAGVLNADEFSEANNILNNADSSGKQALGTGIKWVFAVFLPVLCMATTMIMGYMQQRKKQEQEQNPNKIYIVVGVSAVIGFFIYIIVSMIISRALFGETNYIFSVINEFWKTAVR